MLDLREQSRLGQDLTREEEIDTFVKAMKNRAGGCLEVTHIPSMNTYVFRYRGEEYGLLEADYPARVYGNKKDDGSRDSAELSEIVYIDRVKDDPPTIRLLDVKEDERLVISPRSPNGTEEEGEEEPIERTVDPSRLAGMDYEQWRKATGCVRIRVRGNEDVHEVDIANLTALAASNWCYDAKIDRYYRYDGQIHQHIPDLETAVRDLMHPEYYKHGGKINKHNIEAVLRCVRAVGLPKCEDERYKGNITAWRDGLFNADTGEMLPFRRDFFITTQYEVERFAKFPRSPARYAKVDFEMTIHEEAEIPFVQMYLGCVLFYTGEAPRAIYLAYGTAGTGKGTEISFLRRIIGAVNICSKRLSHLARPFDLIDLYGKVLYAGGEISADDKTDQVASILKGLTGNDLLEGEAKGIQRKIQFINRAKLMFASNSMPRIQMDTGMQDRLFPVTMNRRVDGWTAEYGGVKFDIGKLIDDADSTQGLIDWAYEGYLKWVANGCRFTRSASMEDKLRTLTDDNDPIEAFITEQCGGGTDEEILGYFCPDGQPTSVGEILRTYTDKGYTKYTSANRFVRRIKEIYGRILDTKKINHVSHFIPRGWKGEADCDREASDAEWRERRQKAHDRTRTGTEPANAGIGYVGIGSHNDSVYGENDTEG